MVTIGSKILMIVNMEGNFHATEGLCKHMKWPLSWGGKIKDGCVTCPLHQNHSLHIRRESGRMGAISSVSTLWEACRIHGFQEGSPIFETRLEDGFVQVLI